MKKTEIFIKIRNYHADNHNHVNNARYLEFFEESSWDFLEKNPHVGDMFVSLIKKGIIHVVVNINCNFKSSAIVGDLLRIETKLMRSTNRSYTWSKKIFNNETDKLVVDAEVTCVFIDSASGEVVPINEKMRSIWPELAEQKVEWNNEIRWCLQCINGQGIPSLFFISNIKSKYCLCWQVVSSLTLLHIWDNSKQMKIFEKESRHMNLQTVMVEIIAKKKGCMLCDLALAILEEIAPEFEEGVLQWTVVDVGSKEGVMRQAELRSICNRMPAVPSIVINDRIAFDNIPDMEALSAAVKKAQHPKY